MANATRTEQVLLRSHLPKLQFHSEEFQAYLQFSLAQQQVTPKEKVKQILDWTPDVYTFTFLCVALHLKPDMTIPNANCAPSYKFCYVMPPELDAALLLQVTTYATQQSALFRERLSCLSWQHLLHAELNDVVYACDRLNAHRRMLLAFLLCVGSQGLSRHSIPLMLIADFLKFPDLQLFLKSE